MKRVAVTGAGGFVGSHLVARLLADGIAVRALLRRPQQGNALLPSPALASAETLSGDIRDAAVAARLLCPVLSPFAVAVTLCVRLCELRKMCGVYNSCAKTVPYIVVLYIGAAQDGCKEGGEG